MGWSCQHCHWWLIHQLGGLRWEQLRRQRPRMPVNLWIIIIFLNLEIFFNWFLRLDGKRWKFHKLQLITRLYLTAEATSLFISFYNFWWNLLWTNFDILYFLVLCWFYALKILNYEQSKMCHKETGSKIKCLHCFIIFLFV